ncbi:hypothetical protein [Streptomyces decoyicus]|uniref:hypothetical protein n=1 Tax=Streptomyces decoyicus TaxID=249567 RepID=UPI0036493663
MAAGAAYTAAGMPGLVAAGLAGGAVGAAALARGKGRGSTSAAGRAADRTAGARASRGGRSSRNGSTAGGGSGRGRHRTGGAGRTGRARGTNGRSSGPGSSSGRRTGGPGGRASPRPGSSGTRRNGKDKSGPYGTGNTTTPKGSGKGASGSEHKPSKRSEDGKSKSGKAWQTLKGWANRARRRAGSSAGPSGTSPGKKSSTSSPKSGPKGANAGSTSTTRGRGHKLRQRIRTVGGRLRQRLARLAGAATAQATSNSRLYRLRRLANRKLRHWARCTGAGSLAALGGLLTLPLGIIWGSWRLLTKHRDPLAGFALSVRVAGRIWRFFVRRSKARHDNEAQADELTLTVNDPRKDTDPMSGSPLVAGTAVLDGKNSKFALSMNAARDGYTGYRPTHMTQVAAEYAGLPNGIRAVAEAVRSMAVKSDERYPCSKRAIAKLTETFQVLLNTARRADDMVALFRAVHAFDIQRIREPRTNEWMWNVTPLAADAPEGAMFMPGRLEAGCVLMKVLYQAYTPVHMMQVGSEFQGMGYGLVALADGVNVLHQRTRDLYPVDDRVTNEIGILTGNIRAAADFANMAATLLVEDHRLEISHNTNPRKGPAAEGMWNTAR